MMSTNGTHSTLIRPPWQPERTFAVDASHNSVSSVSRYEFSSFVSCGYVFEIR